MAETKCPDCIYHVNVWNGKEINLRAVCEDCWENDFESA